MIAPIYPAGLGILLVAVGALGFAVRRGELAAVVCLQVMGLGGIMVLLVAARAHGVDGQAVGLVLLTLLCVQGVVTCALVVQRGGAPATEEDEVEEMKW